MLVTLLYRDLDIGIGVIGRLKKKKNIGLLPWTQ